MEKNKVRHITKCILNDGRVFEYDYAISVDFQKAHQVQVDPEKYEFLGEGFLYSMNGNVLNRYNGEKKSLYWRLREPDLTLDNYE